MTNELYEKYKSQFTKRGHRAFPVLMNDEFWIVDWRKEEGGSDYAVRYIIDIKKGILIITGDLGDCVACWYNKVDPGDMAGYVQSIDYFIGKMQCTSDKYTYEYDDIEEDIKAIKAEIIKELEEDGIEGDDLSDRLEEIEDDFDDIQDFFDENHISEHMNYTSDIIDIFQKYRTDWWESCFTDIGQRISARVYLWAVGLREAFIQLDGGYDYE